MRKVSCLVHRCKAFACENDRLNVETSDTLIYFGYCLEYTILFVIKGVCTLLFILQNKIIARYINYDSHLLLAPPD